MNRSDRIVEGERVRGGLSVFRRELWGWTISPAGYLYASTFLALSGAAMFLVSDFFGRGEATLGPCFFVWHPWLHALLIPTLGFRMWSEENRGRMMEILLTLPLSIRELVVAKYLAALIVLAMTLAGSFPIVLTLFYLGRPDVGELLAGYIGSFLVGACFLGISSAVSAKTRTTTGAIVISVGLCLATLISGIPSVGDVMVDTFPRSQFIAEFMTSLSFSQLYAPFCEGRFELRALLCCLTVTLASLWINVELVGESGH